MEQTLSDLIDSLHGKLSRLLVGKIDEVRIERKPSGKIHVTTAKEDSHEAHEAPRG